MNKLKKFTENLLNSEIKDFLDNQEQPVGERIEIPNNISDKVKTKSEPESAKD